MRDEKDTCKECGAWTEAGREHNRERAKQNPIYDTDFSKPLDEIIEGCRDRMVVVRGTLSDIRAAFPGWGERTENVDGLLTCGISELFYIREEMRKIRLAALLEDK